VRQRRIVILWLQLEHLQTPRSIPKLLWLARVLKELNPDWKLPVALVQQKIQGPDESERWADELRIWHRSPSA
jgi:hypothetical protein